MLILPPPSLEHAACAWRFPVWHARMPSSGREQAGRAGGPARPRAEDFLSVARGTSCSGSPN
eukprot:3315289-Pyramimonas_sp.AAC.1